MKAIFSLDGTWHHVIISRSVSEMLTLHVKYCTVCNSTRENNCKHTLLGKFNSVAVLLHHDGISVLKL